MKKIPAKLKSGKVGKQNSSNDNHERYAAFLRGINIGGHKKVPMADLKKMLEKKPIDNGFPFVVWTTKLVGYVIKKMFRVIYSLRQIRNLLKRLMFSLQKQRPEHIRANKEIQRQFKKKFGEELENLIQMDMRSSFWMKAHSNLSHTS